MKHQPDGAEKSIIWTIGHSTHTLDEFAAMTKSFHIELIIDIRSYPGSRRYPHFNKEALQSTGTPIHFSRRNCRWQVAV